jgi:hypothetical protein
MTISRYLFIMFMLFYSGQLSAQKNDQTEKYLSFTFSVGIIGNWILNDVNFYSGFTGVGLHVEPRFSDAFSIALSYNTLNLNYRHITNSEMHIYKIGNRNLNLLLRWRWFINKISIYPEIGFGNWSGSTMVGIIGAGIEYNIYDKIFGSLNFDHIGYCHECLNVEGGGLSGSHYRLTFGLSYLFDLTINVPPVK